MVVNVVLGAAVGVLLVVIALLAWRLSRAKRDLAAAREQMRGRRTQRRPRAVRVAGRAVKNVVDTAAQVRKYGVSDFLMSSIQEFTGWTNEDRAKIATAATPDGIVTIFFSDIQDSTEINERLGDANWIRLLTEHDRLVRAKIAQFGGHVVKTQGDGFMVVFGEPVDGIRAALAIQAGLAHGGGHRLRRTPVRVRIGMHTGVVTSRDGDYFGRNVAMAARVAAHADGGQILVTDDMRSALADTDAVELERGDEVELKGLVGHHQLWIAQPRTETPGLSSVL